MSNRPGIYLVTVQRGKTIRHQKVQAQSAEDAARKILSGTVLQVRWHGGSR